MSTVIDLLATLANNPSLTTEKEITTLLASTDISEEQKQAILAQDSERLAETIVNFPLSMCGIISTPDEDDEQQSQEESKETKNTHRFVVNA